MCSIAKLIGWEAEMGWALRSMCNVFRVQMSASARRCACHLGMASYLLFVMLGYLAGCGESNNSPISAPVEAVPAEEPKLVGVIRKAEAGNVGAQFELGKIYLTGDGAEKDTKKAIEWLQKSAEQGYPGAAVSLGEVLAEGNGVEADLVKAAVWFRNAAERGDAQAQYLLGVAYVYGNGVPKNSEEGLSWLMKAAIPGNVNSQMFLAKIYSEGVVVAKDDAEALNWLKLAAEGGHPAAQLALGLRYASGEGVVKNPNTSIEWFKRAAAQGEGTSQKLIAEYYANQRGSFAAFEWFNKGAMQGDKASQVWIGEHYAKNGDPVLAFTWLSLGVSGNAPDPGAVKSRWQIERSLTAEGLAEANRLVAGWSVGKSIAREVRQSSATASRSIVESNAFIDKSVSALEGGVYALVSLIRMSGRRCDSVTVARKMGFSAGFVVGCNEGRYEYEVEDKGGTWRVTIK